MTAAGISSLVFISTMLSAPSPSPAKVSKSSAKDAEIKVEVVEHRGAKPASFGFVVPTNGSIETWITSGDSSRSGDSERRCTISAEPRRGGTHLDLRCDGGKEHKFSVEATRSFVAGERVKVAEVQRPGGSKSQVFVTLK